MQTNLINTAAAEQREQAREGWKSDAFFSLRDSRVSVVIPTKNEAANLPFVLPRIPQWVHEVLIIDAQSTDTTVEVAKEVLPDARVVQQQGKGKGAALRTGFAAATGDIIVMLDADGSTDPAEIPVFVGALLSGSDFVKGSRFLQGGGTADMELHRQLGNAGLTWMVRLLFGGKFSDLCYGYNAFWRDIIIDLDLDCDGFEIETLMNVRALQAKVKISEVPSFESRRIHGQSNLRAFSDGWRILKVIMRERLKRQAQPHTQPAASHATITIDNTLTIRDAMLEREVGEVS